MTTSEDFGGCSSMVWHWLGFGWWTRSSSAADYCVRCVTLCHYANAISRPTVFSPDLSANEFYRTKLANSPGVGYIRLTGVGLRVWGSAPQYPHEPTWRATVWCSTCKYYTIHAHILYHIYYSGDESFCISSNVCTHYCFFFLQFIH